MVWELIVLTYLTLSCTTKRMNVDTRKAYPKVKMFWNTNPASSNLSTAPSTCSGSVMFTTEFFFVECTATPARIENNIGIEIWKIPRPIFRRLLMTRLMIIALNCCHWRSQPEFFSNFPVSAIVEWEVFTILISHFIYVYGCMSSDHHLYLKTKQWAKMKRCHQFEITFQIKFSQVKNYIDVWEKVCGRRTNYLHGLLKVALSSVTVSPSLFAFSSPTLKKKILNHFNIPHGTSLKNELHMGVEWHVSLSKCLYIYLSNLYIVIDGDDSPLEHFFLCCDWCAKSKNS